MSQGQLGKEERELRDRLRRCGYAPDRTAGGHEIWTKPGATPVSLSIHGRSDRRRYINTKVVQRALR